MPRSDEALPRGVTALQRPRGGRRFRASIRHRGASHHLGLYEDAHRAGLAYHLAAEMIGRRSNPPDEAPGSHRPSASEIRILTGRVASRLGMATRDVEIPAELPPLQAIATFFEVTVLGFWRQQAATDHADAPGASLDSAAGRVVEAAELLLHGRSAEMPKPAEFLVDLLARRVDFAFRASDLTREILDDDGDDPRRVARWLVYPDNWPGSRGFRDEIRHLYPEFLAADPASLPGWADVLEIAPPYTIGKVRAAYRRKSQATHPDKGGTTAAFVRLQEAYDEGMAECRP